MTTNVDIPNGVDIVVAQRQGVANDKAAVEQLKTDVEGLKQTVDTAQTDVVTKHSEVLSSQTAVAGIRDEVVSHRGSVETLKADVETAKLAAETEAGSAATSAAAAASVESTVTASVSEAAGYAGQAKTSETNAQSYASEALSSKSDSAAFSLSASTSEGNANNSATAAAASATNAANSAGTAGDHEREAGNEAANAALSASAAASSEAGAVTAQQAAESAVQSISSVTEEANQAIASASAADASAIAAATSESNAANSATSASISANSASVNAGSAADSESNAAASKTAATASATNADNSATAAAISESNAAASASASASSESNAAASALQAQTDAGQVVTDKTTVQTLKGQTQTLRDEAEGFKNAAEAAGAGVTSVNGQTDAVVTLSAADVGAYPTGTVDSMVSGKADTGHGHAISGVTGLQTALDAKSSTGHGHGIVDITGLQTALDGKAGSSAAIPAGGTAGQVLAKVDATDFNTAFIDPPSGGGGGGAARCDSFNPYFEGIDAGFKQFQALTIGSGGAMMTSPQWGYMKNSSSTKYTTYSTGAANSMFAGHNVGEKYIRVYCPSRGDFKTYFCQTIPGGGSIYAQTPITVVSLLRSTAATGGKVKVRLYESPNLFYNYQPLMKTHHEIEWDLTDQWQVFTHTFSAVPAANIDGQTAAVFSLEMPSTSTQYYFECAALYYSFSDQVPTQPVPGHHFDPSAKMMLAQYAGLMGYAVSDTEIRVFDTSMQTLAHLTAKETIGVASRTEYEGSSRPFICEVLLPDGSKVQASSVTPGTRYMSAVFPATTLTQGNMYPIQIPADYMVGTIRIA